MMVRNIYSQGKESCLHGEVITLPTNTKITNTTSTFRDSFGTNVVEIARSKPPRSVYYHTRIIGAGEACNLRQQLRWK
jgi:hypothetical protein